jgi:hypothetical protein
MTRLQRRVYILFKGVFFIVHTSLVHVLLSQDCGCKGTGYNTADSVLYVVMF